MAGIRKSSNNDKAQGHSGMKNLFVHIIQKWIVPGLIYLILGLNTLIAQSLSSLEQLQYLTVDNGLSQNEVTSILQDSSGFMWFGTRGGLNRFDGYSITQFRNEINNSNSLLNNSIECLYLDHLGRIWIGSKSSGVSFYDPSNEGFTHFRHNVNCERCIRGSRILSMAEGYPGEFWIGTWENGLTIYKEKSDAYQHILNQKRVNDILVTDETVWVVTLEGLLKFDKSGKQVGYFKPGNDIPEFGSVVEDPKRNSLWLSSWLHGLYQFDLQFESFKLFKPSFNTNVTSLQAYKVSIDQNDDIWMGSWGQGLFKLEPELGKFSTLNISPSRISDLNNDYQIILSIFQDSQGIVWIGTDGGGVGKLDQIKNQFGLISSSRSRAGALNNGHILSILVDHNNILWAGTKGGGLNYSKTGQRFKVFDLPEDKQIIKSLFEDKQGDIMVGTASGLYRIKNLDQHFSLKTLYSVKQDGPSNLSGGRVNSILETKDGTLWVGTQQHGLNKLVNYDKEGIPVFQKYKMSKAQGSLRNNRISSMLEDSQKRLWVGTYGGLHLYRPQSDDFLCFNKNPDEIRTLSSDIVICLHQDKAERIWVGTPNGLNMMMLEKQVGKSHVIKCYQTSNGLPNDYIHDILEDDKGNLWLSTNKGLSKFNPNSEEFHNFYKSDGLQANAFSEEAAFKTDGGYMYWGGTYGINYFHPDSVHTHTSYPRVIITQLNIHNKKVNAGQEINGRIPLKESISLSHEIKLLQRENVFSLSFVALDYHASDKLQYAYMLENFDKNWVFAGQKRDVTYTNLPSGDYKFRVKCATSSNLDGSKETQLNITIIPPIWATWQAYFAYFILLSTIFFFLLRVRMKQNKLKRQLEIAEIVHKKDQELAESKNRFFTNITHELRTPLTLISGPIEVLLSRKIFEPNQVRNSLVGVHHHSQRLLRLVNSLLDFRKAETGNMKLEVAEGNIIPFINEVVLSFKEMELKNNIMMTLHSDQDEILLFYDRDKMEIVLCNLIANAFKYAPEGSKIDISISVDEKRNPPNCEILVADNGIGMPSELVDKVFNRFYQITMTNSLKVVGTGIGLALVRNIVNLHNGEISVKSELGKGTEFKILIPQGRDHFNPSDFIPNFKDSEHSSHYISDHPNVEFTAPAPVSCDDKEAPCILVVEDNKEIRKFVCAVLSSRYKVLEAENGKVGLEMAFLHLPDLIVSDIMMPLLNGINMCTLLKEDQRSSHIPVVLLTARTGNVFKVEGYSSGADAYITKPFNSEVFLAQINSLLVTQKRLAKHYGKIITLQPSEVKITPLDEQFLMKSIKIIEDNLQNDQFGAEFLASELAMSSSTLYRKVKALTGGSVSIFIRSVRLKRAAQLISKDSSFNVFDIAYEVGFKEVSYFRKCFKKQFGMAPTQYSETKL